MPKLFILLLDSFLERKIWIKFYKEFNAICDGHYLNLLASSKQTHLQDIYRRDHFIKF